MLGDLRMRWIAHTYIRISSRAYREGFRSRCRSPQSFPSFPVCAYHLADMNNFSKSLGRLLAGYRRPDTKLCELKKRSTSNSLVVVRCQATLTFSLTPQSHGQYPMFLVGSVGAYLTRLQEDGDFQKRRIKIRD